MGNVVLAVVIIASGVIGLVVVVALFVWGAVKDGEDNDAAQKRVSDGEPAPPRSA
ncbi:MAG TPA: hypothetical protein VG652_00375 [Gaiellaceae bacterium]|nr:hypothetical protein [Gaiellaceae bacterium]